MLCRRYQVFLAQSSMIDGDKRVFLGNTSDYLWLSRLMSTYGMATRPLSMPLTIAQAQPIYESIADALSLPPISQMFGPILSQVMGVGNWAPETSSCPPVGVKQSLVTRLFSALKSSVETNPHFKLEHVTSWAKRILAQKGLPLLHSSSNASVNIVPRHLENRFELDTLVDDLQNLLVSINGRCLFRNELLTALKASGNFPYGHLDTLTDILANSGLITRHASIQNKEGAVMCLRCGNSHRVEQSPTCPVCRGHECWTCPECRQMGEARSCIELLTAPFSSNISHVQKPVPSLPLSFEYQLTPPQSDASAALRSFVSAKSMVTGETSQECLVWAVCGAGKTEVAFAAVDEALRRGWRVLFAIPRKDVVLELESRVRLSFGWVSPIVLYGGSADIYQSSQLVLATTHQVLRYSQSFDLVVVDEADAFPFLGSDMLSFALARARKVNSKLIYMTATPDKGLLRRVAKGEMQVVSISARHHGKPLPVPELMQMNLQEPFKLKGLARLPSPIVNFIQDVVVAGDPLFVFAPTVDAVLVYSDMLSKMMPNVAVGWCHSKDPERGEKREAFQRGDLRVLVSTSIMERGITVKGCGVVVMHADFDRIYDSRALIQMAGRAGRSTVRPDGKVAFVGSVINKEMVEARNRIISMNEEAKARGYLH